MTVFVTGGTGFVGSHLIDRLLQRGTEVRCLVRNRDKSDRIFPGGGPQIVDGDLDSTGALEQGCQGVTVVYHVAALVAARSEAHFHQVNVDATARLLRTAARTAGPDVRFVFVSSLAAAGPVPRGGLMSDTAAANPVTDYGRSKLAAEKLVRESGLPWTIVRPPAVYGPRDTEMYKVFRLARYGLAPVFGDGNQEISLIHSDDLAGALVAAGQDGCAGRAYYAAHREVVTTRQLVTEVWRAVRKKEGQSNGGPFVVPIPATVSRVALRLIGGLARATGRATLLTGDKGNEFLAPAWTCDPTELENDTGWQANVDLASGARATAEWYRERGWL